MGAMKPATLQAWRYSHSARSAAPCLQDTLIGALAMAGTPACLGCLSQWRPLTASHRILVSQGRYPLEGVVVERSEGVRHGAERSAVAGPAARLASRPAPESPPGSRQRRSAGAWR